MEETPVVASSNNIKNWELWGTLYVNSLSGTVSSTDSAALGSTAATASTVDFSAGIERYFLNSDTFLKKLSVTALLHKRTVETGQDVKISTDWFEYGGGISYHFYNPPASTNNLIGYTQFSFGTGTVNITNTVVLNGVATETPIKGSNTFISAAIGAKYLFNNGFGFRSMLDYYKSSESFTYPNDIVEKRTLAGPRIQLGLSYRF